MSLPDRYARIARLNALCPYYTMFPLAFPLRQLTGAHPTDWVLDPFCGRGTTNFAARLLGLPSVGIDNSKVAVAIAKAKLVQVEPSKMSDLCRSIIQRKREPQEVPSGRFWRLCYHPRTLEGICKLREELIRDCSSPSRIALRAAVLGVLHGPRQSGSPSYLSNQMPRTYATKPGPAVKFWTRQHLRPKYVDVPGVIENRLRFSLADLPAAQEGFILQYDSRKVPIDRLPRRFRWVITSPPYLGMRSYVPDQWLRNWFLGGSSTVSYAQPGQIGNMRATEFVQALAEVWARIAMVCLSGARLVVRFGALPSRDRDPRRLLKESLVRAGCWTAKTIKPAGRASLGKRQSDQFGRTTGRALEEFDLHAVFEG